MDECIACLEFCDEKLCGLFSDGKSGCVLRNDTQIVEDDANRKQVSINLIKYLKR